MIPQSPQALVIVLVLSSSLLSTLVGSAPCEEATAVLQLPFTETRDRDRLAADPRAGACTLMDGLATSLTSWYKLDGPATGEDAKCFVVQTSTPQHSTAPVAVYETTSHNCEIQYCLLR